MLQPKKQSMMQTTTMIPEKMSESTTRAGVVLPSLIPSTTPQTIPPIPPPKNPTATERPSFDVCFVNAADSAVSTGGVMRAAQNHNHLTLNGGGSVVTGTGFVDGNSCPQWGQTPAA